MIYMHELEAKLHEQEVKHKKVIQGYEACFSVMEADNLVNVD